jgi:putative methyltransferase (TIGR04325 family)
MTDMDKDPSRYAVGAVVPPPYFFGVFPAGLQKAHYDDPFNTEGWIDHCRHAAGRLGIERSAHLADPAISRRTLAIKNALVALRSPSLAGQLLTSGGSLPRYLAPVASMIHDVHQRTGRATVLDVGGGFGDNFFELLRVLNRDVLPSVDYRVVDNPRSCELGRELFAKYRVKPTFYSDHTNFPATNDIVLMVGTLQYIADWRTALSSIAECAGQYFYVARSPITSSEGFTTTQLICPSYGSMFGRNLGATQINVVRLADLRSALPPAWRPTFEYKDVDYSPQFARLPATHREVAYYNMGWQRSYARP